MKREIKIEGGMRKEDMRITYKHVVRGRLEKIKKRKKKDKKEVDEVEDESEEWNARKNKLMKDKDAFKEMNSIVSKLTTRHELRKLYSFTDLTPFDGGLSTNVLRTRLVIHLLERNYEPDKVEEMMSR